MTLPASGPITLTQICDEFALAHSSVFPTAFYGKGGAPASGPLTLEDFYGRSNGFTVTAAPDNISTLQTSDTISTGSTVATASAGAILPVTHSWTQVSGDAISAVTPSNASTIFRATGMGSPEDRTAVFKDTVTDSSTIPIVVDSNLVYVLISSA